jgi:MFS family permease
MASELQIGVGNGSGPQQGLYKELRMNPYLLGLSAVCYSTRPFLCSVADHTQFASLGGFLFGYDQGVVSGVLTMESFGASFPRIQQDSSFKGWFVSTLLLAAWFGSLVNGPVADRMGRKGSILIAVVIFTIGSAFQAGASNIAMAFAGMYKQTVVGIPTK